MKLYNFTVEHTKFMKRPTKIQANAHRLSMTLATLTRSEESWANAYSTMKDP